MSDAYIEDEGDEFPINDHLCCGQVPYKVDFKGASIARSPGKPRRPMSRGIGKTKFLPKPIHPKNT